MTRKRRKSGRRASARRSQPVTRRMPVGAAATAGPSRRAANRSRVLLMIVGAAVLLTGAVAYRVFAGTSPSSPGSSPALLASTDGQAQGEAVDGISCQTSEQVVYHIHAELMVFVDGQSRVIPEGIGIVGCFYWLHSHTRDGIIHIESPVERTYTLGDYFDIWKQPLSTTQVGPATGPVTANVNGVRFSGDPRSIPLTPHAIIQLNLGSDVPAHTFTFPPGL